MASASIRAFRYAELLGFGAQDQVLLRAAMAAWMLVTDDHSFYEIMLAADEHMPPKFKMVQGAMTSS